MALFYTVDGPLHCQMVGKGFGKAKQQKKTVHSTFENVVLFASKACRSTVVEKGRSCAG